MRIETLSTFPGMFDSVMNTSMMRIAQAKGYLDFKAYDLRDWTHDKHRTTDDEPYGGGPGLVMKCEPIFEAYDEISSVSYLGESVLTDGSSQEACSSPKDGTSLLGGSTLMSGASPEKPFTIFLSPQGRRFDDALATELASKERLLFVCGHYEGIDERALSLADLTVSLGDYVLTSGELASMVIIDAVVRKIAGVLGDEESFVDESFYDGLLEYPVYTRPATYRGMDVPSVLLSGNHQAVDEWRRHQRLERTLSWRPDLLEHAHLTEADKVYIQRLEAQKVE